MDIGYMIYDIISDALVLYLTIRPLMSHYPPPPSWCSWSLCLLWLPNILMDGGGWEGKDKGALGPSADDIKIPIDVVTMHCSHHFCITAIITLICRLQSQH